jgi:hypothetical protein
MVGKIRVDLLRRGKLWRMLRLEDCRLNLDLRMGIDRPGKCIIVHYFSLNYLLDRLHIDVLRANNCSGNHWDYLFDLRVLELMDGNPWRSASHFQKFIIEPIFRSQLTKELLTGRNIKLRRLRLKSAIGCGRLLSNDHRSENITIFVPIISIKLLR